MSFDAAVVRALRRPRLSSAELRSAPSSVSPQPCADSATALFERVREFRDWGVSDLEAYTWFMTDVEWAWMSDKTPMEDW